MYTHELSRIQSELQRVKSSIPGSTPDLRVDAIVACLDTITKWIEKYERDLWIAANGP
jgi:hypothetical protein